MFMYVYDLCIYLTWMDELGKNTHGFLSKFDGLTVWARLFMGFWEWTALIQGARALLPSQAAAWPTESAMSE